MHILSVRVCPDRQTLEMPIQRTILIDGVVPEDGDALFVPELSVPLPVFHRPRSLRAGEAPSVWCIASPWTITFLRGVEPRWKPESCVRCIG